jgi:hypothetical protein
MMNAREISAASRFIPRHGRACTTAARFAEAHRPHDVIAGLDPAIHVLLDGISAKKDVDHRDKPGDDAECAAMPRLPRLHGNKHYLLMVRSAAKPRVSNHEAVAPRPFILRGAQERAPQDDGIEARRVSLLPKRLAIFSVTARLDPAIHSVVAAMAAKMDHRVTPGDDTESVGAPRLSLLAAPYQDQTLSPHGEERPLGRVSNHEARTPRPHPSRRRLRLLLRTRREGWS